MSPEHQPDPPESIPFLLPASILATVQHRRLKVRCPVYGVTQFVLTPDTLEIKCHSCRGVHVLRREALQQAWEALNTLPE